MRLTTAIVNGNRDSICLYVKKACKEWTEAAYNLTDAIQKGSDSITTYVIDGIGDDDGLDTNMTDCYSNIRPPESICFFEKVIPNSHIQSVGCYFHEVKCRPGKGLESWRKLRSFNDGKTKVQLPAVQGEIDSIVFITLFGMVHGSPFIAGSGAGCVLVNGGFADISGNLVVGLRKSIEETDFDEEFLESTREQLFRKDISLFSKALRLLSCKNIVTADASDEYNQPEKWRRRMKQPKLQYKVLKVYAPGKKIEDAVPLVSRNGNETIMPHHYCRGHFATYTEEKPLFGKYSGKFWIPAHVRGSVKNGAVVKDYCVIER